MIKWSEIEAELHDEVVGYRAAIVRVFRKYENQETDETDGAGRIVKVTAASFAKHFGIAKQTFHDWRKATEESPDTGPISAPKAAGRKSRKPPTFTRGNAVRRLIQHAQKMHDLASEVHLDAEIEEMLVQIVERLNALEPAPAVPRADRPRAKRAVKKVAA